MADLIDKAPPDPTPAVTPPAAAPSPPAAEPPRDGAAPPGRPPVDLDARLEEVLAEGRRVAELDKTVATRLKRAEELESKFGALAQADPEALARYVATHEHLTKKERAAAVKALVGKVDEDLLFDLAQGLGVVQDEAPAVAPGKQLTVEEQVAAALEAREKAAEERRLEDEKKKTEDQAKAAQTQVDTFLTSSATFLKANLEQFPFIKAWGCDTSRYTQLLIEHAEKTGQMPDPQALLAVMEAEHKAKWAKSPYAPKEPPPLEDLDAHVARTYEQNRPPPGTPAAEPRRLTAYEEAKRDSEAYDREQRERIRYGQGR